MSMAPRIRPSSTWSRGSNPSAAKSRGVPMVSSTTKSSSPPAGVCSVGQVGDREDGGLPGLLGLGLRGLGGLHLGGELLGAGQQRLLLVALGLRDLLAERLLLAPLGLEVADRPAALLVGRQRLVDHRVGQPALGLGGTHAVGLVTENAGVDHVVKASGRPRRGSREIAQDEHGRRSPVPGSRSGPVILLPVLDRPRLVLLGWALLSFALFGVVTLAVVQGWGPVDAVRRARRSRPRSTRSTRAGCRAAAGRRGRASRRSA